MSIEIKMNSSSMMSNTSLYAEDNFEQCLEDFKNKEGFKEMPSEKFSVESLPSKANLKHTSCLDEEEEEVKQPPLDTKLRNELLSIKERSSKRIENRLENSKDEWKVSLVKFYRYIALWCITKRYWNSNWW